MVEYLLKSSACLAILFVFYKFFLEKERMHSFKRYYLLVSLMASLIVPFISINEFIEVSQTEISVPISGPNSEKGVVTVVKTAYWPSLLWVVYLLGVFFFSFKLIFNLSKVLSSIHKNQKVFKLSFVYVLVEKLTVPHTFFSYIFLNKADYFERSIPQEIIIHEETHAREKHSIDIIFVEVLQTLFWINPFVYFIKNAIRLNHEFIADSAVIANKKDSVAYQNLLLAFSSTEHHSLSNSFNKVSLKKRFIAMKTQTSSHIKLLKSLAVIALFAALFYGFAERNKVFVESKTIAANQNSDEFLSIKVHNDNEISVAGKEALSFEGFKKELSKMASTLKLEQINAYTIEIDAGPEVEMGHVSKVKEVLIGLGFKKFKYQSQQTMGVNFQQTEKEAYYKNATFKIKQPDGSYILKKYNELTETRKQNLPSPPSKILPNNPTPSQFAEWRDSSKYGIWIDGKRIANSELKSYSPSNIAVYFISKLEKNAKNYGKHAYQVDLYSNNVYSNLFEEVKPLEAQNIILLKDSIKPNLQGHSKESVQPLKNNQEYSPKNNYAFMVPEAPPLPNPDPVEYVKELAKRGATFYIGPHKYEIEKVIEMVQKRSTEVTIDVSKYPEVRIGGC